MRELSCVIARMYFVDGGVLWNGTGSSGMAGRWWRPAELDSHDHDDGERLCRQNDARFDLVIRLDREEKD